MKKWRRALGIRAGEELTVARLILVFAVIQTSHAFGANGADAIFFLRFGVEQLPLMILISGFAIMIGLLCHLAGLGRVVTGTWLQIVTGVCGVWVLVVWLGVVRDAFLIYPIMWISTQVVIMVTFTVMWNAAGAASTTRQAKRLYPLYASAGMAGGIVGNLLTGPLASVVGTQNLLVAQALALLSGALVLRRSSGSFSGDVESGGTPVFQEIAGAVRTIRVSKVLRLATVATACLSILFYLVVFPFSEVVANSFGTEAEIAGFLGLFASVATAVTFLVSLLITKHLFSRLGIVASLLIVPVLYALGFGWWLGSLTLASAAAVRGLQWVVVNAIGGPAMPAVFNVVTGRRRGEVMSFMTAVPAQIGVIAGGGILMLATTLGDRVLFAIGLALALVASVVVMTMRPAYVAALVESVRRGVTGVFEGVHQGLVSPVGAEVREILESYLRSPDFQKRRMAVVGLCRMGHADDIALIRQLLHDPDALVRAEAFECMWTRSPEDESLLRAALQDASSEVKRSALRHVGSRGSADLAEGVRSLVDDPDPVVAATAAAVAGDRAVAEEIVGRGEAEPIRTLFEESLELGLIPAEPTQLLVHSNHEVRVLAVRATAIISDSLAVLVPMLDDPSIKVRQTTAERMSSSEEGRGLLLGVLDSGSVQATDAALDALTPIGRFTDEFLSWAVREANRASHLTELRIALLAGETSPPVELLADFLDLRSRVLSDWVIRAMTTPETEDAMRAIERGVHSTAPDLRAQAIEAVEMIGSRSPTDVLTALLDADVAAPMVSQVEALRTISSDFDPWLSALARFCLSEATRNGPPTGRPGALPESQLMPSDSIDTLNLLERVLALGQAWIFRGLDPEDLEMIAELVEEVHYAPGEQIFWMAERGTEMLSIISGDAVVSVGGAEITRYGPSQQVGEMSLLRDAGRSADVFAGDAGVQGLKIGKSDLLAILQERPAVGLAMIHSLASRLAEQTPRLDEGEIQ